MGDGSFMSVNLLRVRSLGRAPLSSSFVQSMGTRFLRLIFTLQGIAAFAVITLGVIVTKFREATDVTYPLIYRELRRSGLRLIPMFLFISGALGLVVIGQAVTRLSQVGGVESFLGTVMVAVVVREFGPLLTAMLVLARSGTANVIELGTARAMGEVESLETMGIDPIHYFVMPRVIGMALGVFSLTIYFVVCALASGYAWAFIQNVPLRPGDYLQQLADGLTWIDFGIVIFKSMLFGVVISMITCYHGLSRPLKLEEVSEATILAVVQSIMLCVLLDAVFIFFYIAL
jgi:phospholipid/cholesterol/gamma-HCH transport system permease protein